jgi:hypothetical protein
MNFLSCLDRLSTITSNVHFCLLTIKDFFPSCGQRRSQALTVDFRWPEKEGEGVSVTLKVGRVRRIPWRSWEFQYFKVDDGGAHDICGGLVFFSTLIILKWLLRGL